MLYRDGLAIATSIAGQIELLVPLSPDDTRAAPRRGRGRSIRNYAFWR